MEAASREGRTVVFISHNLPSVMNLCDRAIMLSEGRIAAAGRVSEVIDHYVGDVSSDIERGLRDRKNRDGNGKLRFIDVRFERDGELIDSPASGEDFEIVFAFDKHTEDSLRGARFNFSIHLLSEGTPLLDLDSGVTGTSFSDIPQHGEVRCKIDRCPLPAGQYYIDVRADASGERLDAVYHAAELTVAGGDFYRSGAAQDRIMDYRTVLVDHSWALEAVAEHQATHPAAAASPLA
jgi:lipopolysaccharide transport system ATP-binding protein